MPWRLLASVLVVSETGSVAVTDHHSDWPDEQTCMAIVQRHYTVPPAAQTAGGFKLDIRIKASCVPMRMEYIR